MRKLNICIDFDGTIVSENYPNIGVLLNGAKEAINKWFELGHTIIINTCRSGQAEENARIFLNENGVKFHYLNENNPVLIEKYGMDCRKMSGDIYFDDKNAKYFVDWIGFDEEVQKLSIRKPLIIAIVGPSGSGKTTIAEHIERQFGIKMIESHTDRSKRHPKETGHTFHTREEFDQFDVDDMIAYTEFGNKRYCCLKDDVRDRNTYVIDEYGLNILEKKYNNIYDIVSLKVECPEDILLERAGIERVSRDKGKFTRKNFDYSVNTNCSKHTTRIIVNHVIKDILNSWNYNNIN